MIKKIICMGVLLVMAVSFAACKPPASEGPFYTLQEAYKQGLLNKNDLKNIAYYHGRNDYKNFVPIPKNPEILSKEIEGKIKQSRADEINAPGNLYNVEAKAEDVTIFGYYGTYNNCIAVMITDRYTAYSEAERNVTIGSVLFRYRDGNYILIWKES